MLYPKINSLWKRQGWYLDEGKKHNRDYQTGRQSFIIGDYSCDEFALIKKWRVEEKIDGMNIRVELDSSISFYGRTDEANLPAHLYKYLSQTFTTEVKESLFKMIPSATQIVLFGEGYGPKIQKGGGNYRDEVGFILFDCWAGSRWSTRAELIELAIHLKLPIPYDYGFMTEDEIVELVKSKPESRTAIRPMTIEGVVCRSEPLLISNLENKPVMWKLKCKEF